MPKYKVEAAGKIVPKQGGGFLNRFFLSDVLTHAWLTLSVPSS
jgi:hypothetical protein